LEKTRLTFTVFTAVMSQNSADTSPGNNSKNIPKVVNDHADRLMDGLFADIEELLSGDLSKQIKSQPTAIGTAPQHRPIPNPELQLAGQNTRPEYQSSAALPADNATSVQPPHSGTWKKILIGLGLTAAVAGGGIWWLAKENKINLAFLSSSSDDASKADVQFADYLRRAFGKIDPTKTASPASNQVTIPNPPGAASAAPTLQLEPPLVPASVPAVPASSSFVKVVNSTPPTAEFVIDGKTQQLTPGSKIGDSGWVITTVISALDNEVIIKRNGELRTLKAGQKF
jgi:hypothetical protein